MMKRCLSYLVLIVLCLLLGISLFSTQVRADADCSASSGSDQTAQLNCNSCVEASIYQNLGSGTEIIDAMFNALNGVLNKVMQTFYNGIVSATDFQKAIGAGILLYVLMYGFVIMYGLGTYRVNEVATRLTKVAFVYLLTSPTSWKSFNTWFYTPIIGGMNQLIKEFTQIAEGGSDLTHIAISFGSGAASGGSGGAINLDPTAFSAMFGSSMTSVFSVNLAVAIISMVGTGFFGWLIAVFLFWGLVEFLLMMIGAVITYAKAIIGLAFLFGIAPLFFIFLLFDKTRGIFMAWLMTVLTFALQPVFLFAFLAFYVALINAAVPYLLTDKAKNPTNYCWIKWFSVPGSIWEAFAWRPTSSGGMHLGAWQTNSGKVVDEPVNVPNAVYFLMLCHLGRTFSKFIDTIAENIAGGLSPGTVRGGDVGKPFRQGIGGALRGAQGSGGSGKK